LGDYAAPVAGIIGKVYRIPSIARFYGVIIHHDLSTLRGLLCEFVQVIGFKSPLTKIIATDDGTCADDVAERLGVPKDRLILWKNGVDKSSFKKGFDRDGFRKSIGISPEKRIVIMVTRLVAWKRVDRLIKVIPTIVDIEKDLLFMVVGDGPMRGKLEEVCKLMSIDRYMRFTGPVPQKEIHKYLQISDVFVSLADFSNGGNSLLEAMANGCAIITLRVGKIDRFIKDGYNGILLEPDDHLSLAKRILGLLHNEEIRRRLGRNARRFAEENLPTWRERNGMEVGLVSGLMRG
jgi:glycosyltransferase involved in cell wall biosynthesis